MGKTLALIPAAGRGSRMLALTENSPKSMVPVAGKPLISYLIDQLIQKDITDIAIIVGYKKEVLVDYVERVYKNRAKIQFIEQKELLGLGHAVYTALNEIDTSKYDHLFIMLGDALFDKDSFDKVFAFKRYEYDSYIICSKVDDYSRWCIAVPDSEGCLESFLDKPSIEPANKLAVLGAYYFNDIARFKKSCDTAIQSGVTIKNEYQISTIILDYIKYEDVDVVQIPFRNWYDFGELDTYNLNRRKFNSHRCFNSLSYSTDGVITKKSRSNNIKIQREILWYLSLPRLYKQISAHMNSYYLDDFESTYDTTYVDGLTLQEMWLYNNMQTESWTTIINNILSKIKTFGVFRDNYNEFDEERLSLSNFLLHNLEKRKAASIIDYYSNQVFRDLKSINGKKVNMDLLKTITDKVNELEKNSRPGFLHGDMVFSNMIYDYTASKLTLIDPRGDFNGLINSGDIRYDIAKLAQCIVGDYDYIVNNLAFLSNDLVNGEVELSVYNDKPKEMKDQLLDKIVKELNVSKKEILFITAIQFLTMIPLHSDNQLSQQCMFIKFIQLLNEAEECND